MNKQQTWTVPKIIYAVLMSFLLLGYMIIIATYKDPTTTGQSYNLPIQFWVLRLITSAIAIYLGKLWKDKGFLILIAYLLLKAVRVAVDNPNNLFDPGVSESLLTGFWVFSACYGLARVIEKEHLKKYLFINVTIWTAGMVIYSCIGIRAAWTGQYIYNLGRGSYWGLFQNRLFPVYYFTSAASVLSISILISIIHGAMAKSRYYKIFFFFSIIPMLIAMCLTDTRSAQVSVAAGITIIVAIVLLQKEKHDKENIRKKWGYIFICFILLCGVFVAIVFACTKVVTVFNMVKADGVLVPKAMAEETEKILLSNRGYTGDNVLSFRITIWNSVLQVIKQRPVLLLTGTSIYNPMSCINGTEWMGWLIASHCHCMPLMILLENGIPGVLLIGTLICIFFKRSFNLIRSKKRRLEIYVIPIVLSIMIGETVECFTWLRSGQCPTLPFFFIALGIVIIYGNKNSTVQK